jgi:hypothetical protein
VSYLLLSLPLGLKVEGIFRLSANKEEVKAFKVSIDQGRLPDFNAVDDPHVISNLLSVWLRELPAPLCTLALYERFLAVQGLLFLFCLLFQPLKAISDL